MEIRRSRSLWGILGVVLAVVGITCLWKWTPLADLIAPERLAERLHSVQALPAAPLLFVAIYVLGGLVIAPVLALIVTVAILFPPLASSRHFAHGRAPQRRRALFHRCTFRRAIELEVRPRLRTRAQLHRRARRDFGGAVENVARRSLQRGERGAGFH